MIDQNTITIAADGTITFNRSVNAPELTIGTLGGSGINGVHLRGDDVTRFAASLKEALEDVEAGRFHSETLNVGTTHDGEPWGEISFMSSESFSGLGRMVRIEWEHRSVSSFDNDVWDRWSMPCFHLTVRATRALLAVLED